MLYLSKSKYTKLWQCPKMLWLMKNMPEEAAPVDDAAMARFAAGNEVGDLAMGLFGDFVEVTTYRDDDSGALDFGKMISRTKEEMEKEAPVICEASFSTPGHFCSVDILKKDGDGWAIYEVKSSTHPEKPVYIVDAAYQTYVLKKCGINVKGTYIVTINSEYCRRGVLDIHELFNITDVSELIKDEIQNIEKNIETAEPIIESKSEPDISIGPHCFDPYECGFWEYCACDLPEPSVFDLYRISAKDAWSYYDEGIKSFDDLISSKATLSPIQEMQVYNEAHPENVHIDTDGIKGFLGTLTYPLYFLDFETMQPVIPPFDGTKPYQQIPFQYSLHYIEREGGELKHKEFLAESGKDPRRDIAEALVKDIPINTCVMAYNMGFEKGRIKELANTYPDLANHLMNIYENMVDLLIPFQHGYYYNRAMGGSFSIKSVLPAMFPNDPELDYHNLEGVHNGGEAMAIFPQIQFMSKEDAEAARKNLLKYCELDTYAMVKIWQKLVETCV